MMPIGNFRPIDALVIHCTDSPDDRRSVNAAEIDRWHRERGFKMIGYHRVVLKSGVIERGRPDDKIGAHCLGNNLFSIGMVWVGRDDCNAVQYRALVRESVLICQKYKIAVDRIFGHGELNAGKTCPNLDMTKFRADVAAELNRLK